MNTSAHESFWRRVRRHLAHLLWLPLPASDWQASNIWDIQPVAQPEKPGLPPWANRPLLEITPISMPVVQKSAAPVLPISPMRARALSHGWSYDPRTQAASKPPRMPKEQREAILDVVKRNVFSDVETLPASPEIDPALVTIGDIPQSEPAQYNPLALTGVAADLFGTENDVWLTSTEREPTHALEELADLATMRHNSDTLEVPAYMRKKRAAKSDESE